MTLSKGMRTLIIICWILAAAFIVTMFVLFSPKDTTVKKSDVGLAHATEVVVRPDKGTPVKIDTDLTKKQKKQIRFVKKWEKKLKRYTKGTKFYKYRNTVANAAYKYKVDPRHIVVCAKLESGLGKNEFRHNNSWGWKGKLNLSTRAKAIKSYAKAFGSKYGKRFTASSASTYSGGSGGYYGRYCAEWGKVK
jgi:hypothetical protein